MTYPSMRLAQRAAYDARRDTGREHVVVILGGGRYGIRPVVETASVETQEHATT
jgi:hypothetical protein